MGKITFILGGVRSGKSQLAIKMAKKGRKRVGFIATCKVLDKEMKERIVRHKKIRPGHWQTFEESKDIPLLLKKVGHRFDLVIIDCLTLFVSNLLLEGFKEKYIEHKIKQMIFAFKKIKANAIIISNEVGLGIVPENKLAREFRDIAGRMNQVVAAKSYEVFFIFSGLPLKIKGGKSEKDKRSY